MVVTPNNEFLFTGDKNGLFCQWSVKEASLVKQNERYFGQGISSLQISNDGRVILVGLINQTLRVLF